jgi:hypothetical protein
MGISKFYDENYLSRQSFKDLGKEIAVPYIVEAIQEAIKSRENINSTLPFNRSRTIKKKGKVLSGFLDCLNKKDKKRVIDHLILLQKRPDIQQFIINNDVDMGSPYLSSEIINKYIADRVNSSIDNIIKDMPPRIPLDKLGNPVKTNKALNIFLKSVQCNDLTDWEPGADEIEISFITTDDQKNTIKHGPFDMGSFENVNQKKEFPSMLIHSFNLDTNYNPPKIFTCTALLAEIDLGGFAKYIDNVWNIIDSQVYGLIFNAISGNAAVVALSIPALLAPVIVMLVAAIVALIFVYIIGAIIEALKDDFFDPFTFAQGFNSTLCTLDNQNTLSLPISHVFEKHGGKYTVELQMELVRS